MAADSPVYDDFYAFSKEIRNHSVDASNGQQPTYGVRTGYINLSHSEPRTQHEHLTQKSLPNLKQSNACRFKRQSLSESEPLLGNRHFQKRQHLLNGAIEFTRDKRTQIFLVFYIVFYVAFLVTGSFCFQRLEYGAEQKIRKEFREAREDFLNDHPSITGTVRQRFAAMECDVLCIRYSRSIFLLFFQLIHSQSTQFECFLFRSVIRRW